MRKRLLCIVATGFMVAAGGAEAQVAREGEDRTENEAAILGLVSAFHEAANKHDAGAFASFFVPDAEFTNVVGMTVSGRRAIEEFHRPLFEGDTSRGTPSFKNSVFKPDSVKVRFLRPDVASVDIRYTHTGSRAPDGREVGTRKGLLNLVVTKEEGKWQVAVLHNTDLTVAPPARPQS
jgi:uncharacterized protein (TIGR02246 family)